MSKFVASVVEIPGAVNITMDEFRQSLTEKGGLQSAVAFYVEQAVVDFADEKEIFFVDGELSIAENMVSALNAQYIQELELIATHTPTYSFAGTNGEVAYGGEVVSSADTAEAAINNIINQSTKNQTNETKGAVVEMTNQTVDIKNVVANLTGGTSDSDALAIAEKFRQANSAKMKDAQTSNNVKEEVEMNNRKGSGTVVQPNTEFKRFSFGGNTEAPKQEENKGGNDNMTNNTRKGGGAATPGFTPSFSYNGPVAGSETETDATDLEFGFDDSARGEKDSNFFDGAWYLNPNKYPSLKNLVWYLTNRHDIPANPLGLTGIRFLDPKKKNVIFQQPNNYATVIEFVFGHGVNIRVRVSSISEQTKAELKALYARNGWGEYKSKADFKSSNITWEKNYRTKELEPKYCFYAPNQMLLAVKCSCGKKHEVSTSKKTTCESCGKKFDAVGISTDAQLEFLDAKNQPQYNEVVLDNFNILVDKDILALALAAAQFQFRKKHNLDMAGLLEVQEELTQE